MTTELDRLLLFRSPESPVVSIYVTFRPEAGLKGERAQGIGLVGEAVERVAVGGLGATGLPCCLLAVNEHADT